MDTIKELLPFMQLSQRLDLKAVALTHVLALTGTAEGKAALLSVSDLLKALFTLTCDKSHPVAKDAVLCLINLSAENEGAIKIFESADVAPTFPIVDEAVRHILDEDSQLADAWCCLLSNLSRVEILVSKVLNILEKEETIMLKLVKAFAIIDYNKRKAKLHYLASLFCNLTQISRGRELFCHEKYNLLDKVLPFAAYEDSVIRRGGIIGIVKNICFDPIYHDKILSDRDDILHHLLYPLCGPEEFSDEDNEKFPITLQYLDETKTREEDPDIRKMLLESLLQLCATRRCRELLREKGVYEILREYHKWEASADCSDRNCLLACENVIDILIKKEDEIGLDNYKDVEVPPDMSEKFIDDDTEYIENLK